MNAEELKKRYGDEYPAAITFKGRRMPLAKERRFSRFYSLKEERFSVHLSRFMDESASMTAADLQIQWPRWTESERHDFCFACGWLSRQPDFPEMVRFIMQHGGRQDWTTMATNAAGSLPKEEAFDLLLRVLSSCEPEHTANITQAIAITKHSQAESVLRDHLEVLWRHERLWEDASFTNWIAFSATTCIAHLIICAFALNPPLRPKSLSPPAPLMHPLK
jgi:hypothetical protein